jgi:hypothetical protein
MTTTTTTQLEPTFVEVTLDGVPERFKLTPLDRNDYRKLRQWAGTQIVGMAVASIREGMDKKTTDLILHTAFRQALDASFGVGETFRELISTHDGSCVAVFLSLRHNHPNVTQDQVNRLLENPGAMLKIATALATLTDGQK